MEQFFLDFANAVSEPLQALLLGVINLLALQAVAWVNKQYQLVKSRVSLDQQAVLDVVVFHAVRAAEQVYKNEDNEAKRAYAMENAELALLKYGIKLDIDLIANAVESAVWVKNEQVVEPPVEAQG